MAENQNEAVEPQVEEQEQTTEKPVEEVKPDTGVTAGDDGTIKVDLTKLNKPKEDAVQEQSTDDSDVAVGQPEDSQDSEEVVEEVRDTEEKEVILEEITDETNETNNTDEGGVAGSTEATDAAPEQEEVLQEEKAQVELPEGLEKVIEFMNETGGDLNDYVKLNTDYSKLNNAQLIREYYETTKPHLDAEDINLLMEDFNYDEEIDEPKQIRKAKLAFKEEAAKAKNHLETLKSKYYQELKSGGKLLPEQQKAVEFFNRYKKEQQLADDSQKYFYQQTDSVFNKDFKGFEYNVGDKKYRFNVKDTAGVKETQSDINNFVKKFLNEKNQMSDAKGYHKSLFTAMNADAIANHFYEQGKADAMRDSIAKSKNVDMDPRGSHEKVTAPNGWTIRAVPSDAASSSKLKIRTKRK
mgnify:CR=1 FL=1